MGYTLRDPKRIPNIIMRLLKIWQKYPDMRLGQLIENVFPNTEMTRVTAYFLEDDDFIKVLEEFYKVDRVFRVGGEKDLKKVLKEFQDQKL